MLKNISPIREPVCREAWYRKLYIQVLLAVALGIIVGWLVPDFGKSLKPLGDGFIRPIKMIIAPIIFAPLSMALPRWAT
jgi:Na+/H+-dicarboxylate symporter